MNLRELKKTLYPHKRLYLFSFFLLGMTACMPFTPRLQNPQGQRFIEILAFLLYIMMGGLGARIFFHSDLKKRFLVSAGPSIVLYGLLGLLILQTEYAVEKIHYFQYILIYSLSKNIFAGSNSEHYGKAFFLSVIIGILDKSLQNVIPGRVFDFTDVIANILGCVFGLLFAVLLQQKTKS